MAVIRPEISTDPAELEQIAIDFLREGFPGWEPHDGDLMTWLIGAHARMVAEERDIAADVPIEQILRPLGEEVHRVLARVATPATVTATVTLRDDRGYTIPAGTEVLVRTAGDDGVTMAVTDDVTVLPPSLPEWPGSTSANVVLRAIAGREGTAGNGLRESYDVVPIRPLEFIRSIRLTGTSYGGTDAETDEQYLQRLVDTLALTSPVPILPEDFAAIARQQVGVGRALAINNALRREEVLRIETDGSSVVIADRTTGRAFTVAAGASNDDVEALFAEYDPTVEDGPLGIAPIRLRLRGRTRYGPWELSVPPSSTGSLTVLQTGGELVVRERAIIVAVVGPDGDDASTAARRAVREALEAARELNWSVSVIDPTPNPIEVDYTAVAWPTYDALSVRGAADQALRAYLSPARWGMAERLGETDGTVWVDEPIVRYLEVAQVLNEVPGLRYVTDLRIAGVGGTLSGDDIQMVGIAPLPEIREITGEVLEG